MTPKSLSLLQTRCFVVLIALVGLSPGAAAVELPSKAAIENWADDYIEAALKSEPAAGATILIGKGDQIIFEKAYGLSDIENGTPAKVNSVYQIGSLTKQFTAAAILQLEQEGKLSLDDDISKYLPNYPTHGEKITISDILHHTSGIPNYIAVGSTDSKIAPGHLVNQADYRIDLRSDEMTKFFEDEPLEFKPGTSWNYTNSGYFLAGMIVEKVSGMSFGDYVEKNLFQRASMSSSYYTDFERVVPNRAHGYKVQDGKLLNADALSPAIPFSAGALSSTALDLFKWNMALHRQGTIVGKAEYTKMVAPGHLKDGTPLPINYGLGIASPTRNGHKCILHPGGINGYSAVLSYFPDDEVSIVVLTNTYNKEAQHSLADTLESELAAFVFGGEASKFYIR